MAAPTLGEAIALQGVTKPADNFGALVRGMQTGQMFQQRRQAGDAKVQKMISDGIQLKPEDFPTRAHYERAKKDTEEYMMKAYERKKQVGDNRFLNDPDFQQLKTNYLYGIENLKADSKNAAELIKLNREGKIWVDPDYIKAANSSWDEYAAYKNDITGEGVDPVSRRSNVTAVPKGDLAKVVKERFDPRNEALYNQKGEQRRYGGVNDYGLEYWVDPKQKMAIIEQIVVDHPELAERYLKMDKQNVDARAKQILQEAAAKGMEVLDINKARAAAAKEFLMRDADKYIQQYVIKDIRVPEPKKDSGGGDDAYGVSDLIKGGFTINVPSVDASGKVTDNPRKLNVESNYTFSTRPTKALVSNSKNIRDFNGQLIDDPNVQQATYGQFALVPVYKQGSKSIKGQRDISGRIVPNEQLASQKGTYEYVPVAIGEYTTGTGEYIETVNIYRPINEIEGAILSEGSAKYKRKVKENFDQLKQEANRLNNPQGSKPAQTQTTKQKTYKAADLNDKVVAEIKENEIVVIDGVERIKQGGVLKKVKR